MPDKILIIDDDLAIGEVMSQYFEELKYQTKIEINPQNAMQVISSFNPDFIFLDLKMPRKNGLTVLREIKKEKTNAYVIMMTAYATLNSIIEALRAGVDDYILKPFKLKDLDLILERGKKVLTLKKENLFLKNTIDNIREDQMIGEDPAILQIIETSRKLARLDITVVIYGESGTGKDLLAKLIHRNSARASGPYIAVNLGAIPSELAESELFGHKKGAFTGATSDKEGLFKAANHGTIFLDEIGEASPAVQVKLLRALEEKTIMPVGSTRQIEIDTRIIVATNQNLKQLVKEHKFREDLFFRLNVYPIRLPPLRQRKKDIILLAEYFLKKYENIYNLRGKNFDSQCIEFMQQYHWPGNIRELKHAVERGLVSSKDEYIKVQDLGITQEEAEYQSNNNIKTLSQIEKEAIEMALSKIKNKKEVARMLGIDTSTLYRKLKKYGINFEEGR